jgi:predicted ATPase
MDVFTDSRVACLGYLAHTLYALGYPTQARAQMHQALQRAQALQHGYTLAWIWHFGAALHQVLREYDTTRAWAHEEQVASARIASRLWDAGGMIQQGWAIAMQGQVAAGIEQIRRGMDQWRATGAVLAVPRWCALLAEAYGRTDQPEAGMPVLEQALLVIAQTAERNYEAEVHRLKGVLLLQQHPVPDMAEAERCFQQSINVARRQQAKAFELRTTIELSRLWQQQGKREEAHQLLAELYGWFSEGFETADIQEGRRLLETLAR